uniref:Ig-like domain-containing protein n=1 Tax=Myripristis murdjan TaxID=586833 RepID=A0A667Y0M0_9TELE
MDCRISEQRIGLPVIKLIGGASWGACVCLSVYLSDLSVSLPVCLSDCRSTCLSVCLSAVLFLVCPERGLSLELSPSGVEVLLSSNSSFSVVCSGWAQVLWRLPRDSVPEGVVLDNQGSSSVLQLHNATWRHSGRYICEEASSDETKELDIFIPGRGDEPAEHLICREGEEGTIPCVVSDPRLNVTLYERPGRAPVSGVTFQPGRGFTGRLNDTSYVCSATQGGEERESQVFYVFSIVGE